MSFGGLPLVRLLVLLSVVSGAAAIGFAGHATVSASSHAILATVTATPGPAGVGTTSRPNPGGSPSGSTAPEPPVTGGAEPAIPKTGFGGTAKSGSTLPASGGAAGDSSNPLLPLSLVGLALIGVGRVLRRQIRR